MGYQCDNWVLIGKVASGIVRTGLQIFVLSNDTNSVSELGGNAVTALPHIASIPVVFGILYEASRELPGFLYRIIYPFLIS
jgi:hypothetical protein